MERRIERDIHHLVTDFGDISSVWLCGSRANEGSASGDDDWDLLVFGERRVAEALESSGNFLGRDVDLKFVDLATGELKRLWRSADWEDFQSWFWVERTPTVAEYHSVHFGDQLVMMGGEWVEAGELTVTRKRAVRLWPEPQPQPETTASEDDSPVN